MINLHLNPEKFQIYDLFRKKQWYNYNFPFSISTFLRQKFEYTQYYNDVIRQFIHILILKSTFSFSMSHMGHNVIRTGR